MNYKPVSVLLVWIRGNTAQTQKRTGDIKKPLGITLTL